MVFPIIRIFKSYNKKYAFKRELPLLIIGLLIAISGNFIFWVLIKVLGGVFALLGLYLFILIFTNKISIFKSFETKTTRKMKEFIDADYEERD